MFFSGIATEEEGEGKEPPRPHCTQVCIKGGRLDWQRGGKQEKERKKGKRGKRGKRKEKKERKRWLCRERERREERRKKKKRERERVRSVELKNGKDGRREKRGNGKVFSVLRSSKASRYK